MADDTCLRSRRVDGPLHSWVFDGDDPYIVCAFCGERRDALTGRVLTAGRGAPVRIQRKRTKGWRMPEGAVYVGRGSKWGNPFAYCKRSGLVRHLPGQPSEFEYEGRVSANGMTHPFYAPDGTVTDYRVRYATREEIVELYRRTILAPDRGMLGAYPSNGGRLATFRTGGDRRGFRGALHTVTPDLIRAELRGLDLACWCPLDQPCHADVLLELANSREGRDG